MLKYFITLNQRLSLAFDRLLPHHVRQDGHGDYTDNFARRFLRPGMTVYDVGGGKLPLLSAHEKADFRIRYIGLDIDGGELARAPQGLYDKVIEASITSYQGAGDGDLIFCRALLEHVPDTKAAMASLASLLRPGGRLLLFVPSRNAVFARLNLLFPESFKRWLLFRLHPEAEKSQGFPSYYHRCTPRDFRDMAQQYGLELEEERIYWRSRYFTSFLPLHIGWRMYQSFLRILIGRQAAETFSMCLIKA